MIKLLSTAAFGFGLTASSSAFAAEKTVTMVDRNMFANLMAPHQAYFIAATVACLRYGYRMADCAIKVACGLSLPNRIVKTGIVLTPFLVAGCGGGC